MGDTLMAYGTLLTDAVQSSTANTPPQFNDGNGTQVGTLCRAWVNFNGVTTATIRASFNVSSVTRNGTGDYTVNFINNMSDVNYSVNATKGYNAGTATGGRGCEANPSTVSAAKIYAYYGGSLADDSYINVAIFR